MNAPYLLRIAAAVLDSAPGITTAHFAAVGETRQELVAGLRKLAADLELSACPNCGDGRYGFDGDAPFCGGCGEPLAVDHD